MERREGARDDRRDRNPIQNEAAAVIHEALALHQHHQLAWDAEATRDRGRRQRIRGRDDRSQNERARPRQAVDELMSDNGHADGCHTDESDRQQADRPNVRTQVTKRGEERRAVEQRRKDAEEDELRLELELGHRTGRARSPAHRVPTGSGTGSATTAQPRASPPQRRSTPARQRHPEHRDAPGHRARGHSGGGSRHPPTACQHRGEEQSSLSDPGQITPTNRGRPSASLETRTPLGSYPPTTRDLARPRRRTQLSRRRSSADPSRTRS